MFAIPEAKRVRREDLRSPASSRASSPNQDALELFRAKAFEYEVADPTPTGHDVNEDQDENGEDEAEFNLFARPAVAGTITSTRIQLRSPSPNSDGGLVGRGRPLSHYMSLPLTEDLSDRYRVCAVSGADVKQRSTAYWPGSTYAWRVRVLPAASDRSAKMTAGMVRGEDDATTKRKRLGKKGRIKLRKQAALKAERRAEEHSAQEAKARAEREKKARRNREKKFKKRARDKLKRQDNTADVDQHPDGDQEGSSSSAE